MKIASRIVIAPNVDTTHIQLFDNSEIFRHRKGSYHGQGSLDSMQTRKEIVPLREKRDIQKFTKKREKSSNARTPGAKHHHHHRSWIQRLLVWVPPGVSVFRITRPTDQTDAPNLPEEVKANRRLFPLCPRPLRLYACFVGPALSSSSIPLFASDFRFAA